MRTAKRYLSFRNNNLTTNILTTCSSWTYLLPQFTFHGKNHLASTLKANVKIILLVTASNLSLQTSSSYRLNCLKASIKQDSSQSFKAMASILLNTGTDNSIMQTWHCISNISLCPKDTWILMIFFLFAAIIWTPLHYKQCTLVPEKPGFQLSVPLKYIIIITDISTSLIRTLSLASCPY